MVAKIAVEDKETIEGAGRHRHCKNQYIGVEKY